jgi:hypothetical protein
MKDDEARSVVKQQVEKLRRLSYSQLNQLLKNEPLREFEISTPSGKTYQVGIEVRWDDPKSQRNIRAIVAIDGGGLRVVLPFDGGVHQGTR